MANYSNDEIQKWWSGFKQFLIEELNQLEPVSANIEPPINLIKSIARISTAAWQAIDRTLAARDLPLLAELAYDYEGPIFQEHIDAMPYHDTEFEYKTGFSPRTTKEREQIGLNPAPQAKNRKLTDHDPVKGIPMENPEINSKADLADTILDLYQKYKETGEQKYKDEAESLSQKHYGEKLDKQRMETHLKRRALVAQTKGLVFSSGLVTGRTREQCAALETRYAQSEVVSTLPFNGYNIVVKKVYASGQEKYQASSEAPSTGPRPLFGCPGDALRNEEKIIAQLADTAPSTQEGAESADYGGKQFTGFLEPNIGTATPEGTKLLAEKRVAVQDVAIAKAKITLKASGHNIEAGVAKLDALQRDLDARKLDHSEVAGEVAAILAYHKRTADVQHPNAEYQYGSSKPSAGTEAPVTTSPEVDQDATIPPPPAPKAGKMFLWNAQTGQYVEVDASTTSQTA